MEERLAKDVVEQRLRGAGFKYRRDPSIAGLRPDFIVEGPGGQLVIVEVKAWQPGGGNTARALEQAEYYRRATNSHNAIVVLPELKRNFKERGVVSTGALVDTLQFFFQSGGHGKSKRSKPSKKSAPLVFAAMPFEREYDDTFFVAMSHAAEKIDSACKRIDRTEFSGDIVEEIKRLIKASIAVIVDLSDSRPNVLYEAGYAHALRKPTVHICSTPLAELPFDVRNWNTIPYTKGQTAALRDPLARRLAAAVQDA